MTIILDDLSPEAILPAMDANLGEYCLLYGRLPGAEAHDDPSLRWVVTGLPDEAFNGVSCAQLASDEVDGRVERMVGEFRRHGVPARWQIGPTTRPSTLGAALLAHGFTHSVDMAGMALDLKTLNDTVPIPEELSIEPVLDLAGLHAWIDAWGSEATDLAKQSWWQVFSKLGLDSAEPWQYFLGRWRGEPVTTVKLHDAAGVVCVHHVATIPTMRRRGIGTAIVAHALRAARGRGYRVAVLTSSPFGFGSYLRLGFRAYCTVRRYCLAAYT